MEGRAAVTLEEMFDENGWYTEELYGQQRYVTRDERGKAVVGPRRRGGRGLMAIGHGSRKANANQRPQKAVVAELQSNAGEEVPVVLPSASVRDKAASWTKRQRARWERRFKDKEWHSAVQHTALDVALWAACGSFAAVCVKAAWFVVTLG